MKVTVFNKVLLDTIEYSSFEDMKRRNFCGDYLLFQIKQQIKEKGTFENEFYTIEEVVA